MPPYSIPFFPSGNGEAKDCAVEIGNENIMLSTLQRQNGGIMFRLFNTQNIENTADVFVFGTNVKISLAPFEYKTYMFMNNKIYEITE